jgi:hypothetical protein
MFNTENICMDCKDKEQGHPQYDLARTKDVEAIKKGNYNFEGIGLPDDLRVSIENQLFNLNK